MSEINNQIITQQTSILDDGVLFNDIIISNEPDPEKAKIYYSGNLCYKRNNRVRKIRELQYICDYYHGLKPNQMLKKSYGWKIFCILFWVFWGVAFMVTYVGEKAAKMTPSYTRNYHTPTNEYFWTCISYIMLGLFVGFFILMIIRHKFREKKAAKQIANLRNEIVPPALEKIKSLNYEVISYERCMFDRNVCNIPQYYWDYGEIIASYVYNSRAGNLKEAINIFEMDRHNQSMRLEQQK